MSYSTYAKIQSANESGRDLEIRAISHITRQLADANAPGTEPMTRIRALNGNIQLWTLLMQDLNDPGNALPAPIKARYVSIGLYARRASMTALSKATDLTTLIRINTDVLDALDYQHKGSIAA